MKKTNGSITRKVITQLSQAYLNDYKKEAKDILKSIQEFDRIVIFRHIRPDYDALGTQLGLYTFLKDNFPTKDIHFVGDNHSVFTPRLYPKSETLNESYMDNPFLGIVVDVSNEPRIADPRFAKASKLIKIDHHPETSKFADISITNTKAAAAAEIVAAILLSWGDRYVFSKDAASYFYTAIVGDSGRFQYNSTSSFTLALSSYLLTLEVDIVDIYNRMYVKKIEDLEITKFILNNYKISKKGIAYYVMSDDDQKNLGITVERVKENVNMFSTIEGINIWMSIGEDLQDKCYRISIRSKFYVINEVATKYEGGGHAFASGAKIDSLEQVENLIADLEKVI